MEDNLMPTIPDSLKPYFEASGWTPEREPFESEVDPQHPAYGILEAFGGIHIGLGRDGEMAENVSADIHFKPIDSRDAVIREWGRLLGSDLFGFAEYHHAHGELYISRDGRVFCRSQIHDAFGYQADSFDEALEGLLTGKRSLPMLRPDQEEVNWYGNRYRAGDAGLYDYRNATE